MNRKIIGVTVGTPLNMRVIKETLKPVTSINGVEPDKDGNAEIQLPEGDITTAVEEALAQAKASGEFDGPPGEPGAPGEDLAPPIAYVVDGKLCVVANSGDPENGAVVGYYTPVISQNGADTAIISFIPSDDRMPAIASKEVTLPAGPPGDPGAPGEPGQPGNPGDPGYTPVKGEDYFTETDKTEMVNAVLAALPTWEGGSY